MKVLIATSEAVPFAKTGGLADVVGSLLTELRKMGVDARVIIPLYRSVKSGFKLDYTGRAITIPIGSRRWTARLFSCGDSAFFVECDEFFDRKEIYGTSRGAYEDNASRFIFFSRAVLEAGSALGFIPDVVHCNDWQTGLVPLYLRTLRKSAFRRTASLFTIHNLGYQGIFPASTMSLTGLPTEMFNPDELEFHGNVNLLKAGVIFANAVNTVSAHYAVEIMEEQYGFGLSGVLRKMAKDITGILNGIDSVVWDPAGDSFTPRKFSADDLAGKEKCKDYLAERSAFRDKGAPLAGMVGRLASQKGIEYFIGIAEELFSLGLNVAVLGKGEEAIQRKLRGISRKYPGRLSLNLGYDEGLAHLIYAGADMLFIPSRYEPCGLTQMIAMRYGTVPVARATGGLVDTVEDYNPMTGSGTGFLFSGLAPSAFLECVKRALCVYNMPERWRGVVMECMKKDFSWESSAKKYAALYGRLRGKVRG